MERGPSADRQQLGYYRRNQGFATTDPAPMSVARWATASMHSSPAQLDLVRAIKNLFSAIMRDDLVRICWQGE